MAGGGQSGTPRGFSLANAPYIGNPSLPAGFPTTGMPGLAGPTGVWNGNMLMSGDAGMHQPGVMRRGPNRHNNRSGPYDRRRGYNGGPTGRLSPVRMPNMYGPGGRFPQLASPFLLVIRLPTWFLPTTPSLMRWVLAVVRKPCLHVKRSKAAASRVMRTWMPLVALAVES